MTNKEAWIAARAEGRAASPGDANPYAGTGIRADMWRLGYRSMLLDRLVNSPARRAFLVGE
ncbi:hypothetical protein SEA_ELLIE_8 [Mycobacterium phage Ellie]|uniref:Uncharacterized protein n=2 Tax=Amginevirus TaxID=2946794 RepID=A0A222ZNK6_9CAUD|nr:hypothetical protein I5G84_gp09 [Mycobacterium phage Amgine]YP_009952153.1 hypothetical protein I5G88_gp08 [Mycobacterium phage Ellie]ASR85610.1 hypothetical protein SEA_AMGINE_9 [Mycobacterium phage Amgine]QNJ58233.1 hypothetical protein SEA_ELLIE_8 [Mycobacterium phage Ellie]QTF82010.1 hypothetical protein SEA_FEFFERHEAD_10 [Mycobacterium phage Fefferhead]